MQDDCWHGSSWNEFEADRKLVGLPLKCKKYYMEDGLLITSECNSDHETSSDDLKIVIDHKFYAFELQKGWRSLSCLLLMQQNHSHNKMIP